MDVLSALQPLNSMAWYPLGPHAVSTPGIITHKILIILCHPWPVDRPTSRESETEWQLGRKQAHGLDPVPGS